MGKYGSGITFGTACSYEKEEIKHALNGEVLDSWDEEGRHWRKATKEETDKVILAAYDELFYQADQLRASGCAMDKIHGSLTKEEFEKYMMYREEDLMKHSDNYRYEFED